jgi:hypothetical protein
MMARAQLMSWFIGASAVIGCLVVTSCAATALPPPVSKKVLSLDRSAEYVGSCPRDFVPGPRGAGFRYADSKLACCLLDKSLAYIEFLYRYKDMFRSAL